MVRGSLEGCDLLAKDEVQESNMLETSEFKRQTGYKTSCCPLRDLLQMHLANCDVFLSDVNTDGLKQVQTNCPQEVCKSLHLVIICLCQHVANHQQLLQN